MFLDTAKTVFKDKVGIKKKTVNVDLDVFVSCQSTALACIHTISYDKEKLMDAISEALTVTALDTNSSFAKVENVYGIETNAWIEVKK